MTKDIPICPSYELPANISSNEITGIEIDETVLFIQFGKTKLEIADQAQCCCEHRYMTTDDDLDYFVGAKFIKAEVKPVGGSENDEYETHDTEFLEITTSKGQFTIENHNVHNGYYGGFSLTALLT